MEHLSEMCGKAVHICSPRSSAALIAMMERAKKKKKNTGAVCQIAAKKFCS